MCCASAGLAQEDSSGTPSFFSVRESDEGVRLGVRGGINFSGLQYAGYSGTVHSRLGFQIGLIVDIPLVESFHIVPGLFFVLKESKREYVDYGVPLTDKYDPTYIELPILVSTRFYFGHVVRLEINAGPYLAYGTGGKVDRALDYIDHLNDEDFHKYYSSPEEPDFFDKHHARRLDYGLQFGLGLTIAKHYYVGTSYDLGLYNYAKNGTMKNRSWYINLGYNF